MYCSNCGNPIKDGSMFCSECGIKLNQSTESSNAGSKDVVKPEDNSLELKRLIFAYISHDESGVVETQACTHYYQAFEKIRKTNQPYSWNWAAFLLGGFNLLYRKSYLLGALLLIIPTLLSLVIPFIGPVTWIVCGIFADQLHYNRFLEKKQEAENNFPSDVDAQCKFLAHC